MTEDQFNHQIFHTEWDIAINIGVKCNLLQCSRDAGIRYISSPFDNMDSVDGLTEAADLICSRFMSYFDSPQSWSIRPHICKTSGETTTLILSHSKYPNLYFPHFYERWFPNKISKREVEAWIKSIDPDINFGLNAIKHAFTPRQDRLVRILTGTSKNHNRA